MYKLKLLVTNIKRRILRVFITEENILSRITPNAGSSTIFGKKEIIELIGDLMPDTQTRILDVGPGKGIYNYLLKIKGYKNIDAVEVYKPYIVKFRLKEQYHNVFNKDIVGFEYDFYDVVIFGDVLEHIRIKDAKKVLDFAKDHGTLIVVSVPYLDNQIGQQIDGSGDHQQNDLTRDVFLKRYNKFKLLIDNERVGVFYCFNNVQQK